jgi:hypothetical protein
MRVSLYAGQDRFDENIVGTLDGDTVETGGIGAKSYPGRLGPRNTVLVGQYSSEMEVGKVDVDGHTILQTLSYGRYEPVGEVDPDGQVFLGTGGLRQRAGRVEPPHTGAAACLVGLILLETPRTGSARATTDRPPKHQVGHLPRPETVAKVAAGAAGGLVGAGLIELVRSTLRSTSTVAPTGGQPWVADLSTDGLREITAQLRWLGLVDGRGPGCAAQIVAEHAKSHRELLTILWGQFCGVIAVLGGLDWPMVLRGPNGLLAAPDGWISNGWQVVPTAAPTCTQRFAEGARPGLSTMSPTGGSRHPASAVELSADGLREITAQFHWLGLAATSGPGGAARVVADHLDNHGLLLNLLWAQFCGLVAFLAGLDWSTMMHERKVLPDPPPGWVTGGWQILPTAAPGCLERFGYGARAGLQ